MLPRYFRRVLSQGQPLRQTTRLEVTSLRSLHIVKLEQQQRLKRWDWATLWGGNSPRRDAAAPPEIRPLTGPVTDGLDIADGTEAGRLGTQHLIVRGSTE